MTPLSDKPKLRTFRIKFAIGLMERTNEFMRKADVGWDENSGAYETGTITTHNELPFEDYKVLITKAFVEYGGKLFHIEEIIS